MDKTELSWSAPLSAIAAIVSALAAVAAAVFAYRAHQLQKRTSQSYELAEHKRASKVVLGHLHRYEEFCRKFDNLLEPRLYYAGGDKVSDHVKGLTTAFSLLIDLIRADWHESRQTKYVEFGMSEIEKLSNAWPRGYGAELIGTWNLPAEVKEAFAGELQWRDKTSLETLETPGFLKKLLAYEDL